jgi:hypothetical protein
MINGTHYTALQRSVAEQAQAKNGAAAAGAVLGGSSHYVSERGPSEVEQAMNRLDNANTSLRATAERLAVRLAPVLVPQPVGASSGGAIPTASPLAGALNSQADRTESVIADLCALIDALAI